MATFGAPGLSSILLTGLGVAIEALALGLPTLATVLVYRGDRHGATVAWCLWIPAVTMVSINSCGFSSRYLGDGVFAREQVTDHAAARKTERANLKIRRHAIHELRSVAEIDVVLNSSQSSLLYRRTSGCSQIRGQCQDFCQAYHGATLGRQEALSRDTLDSKISALEREIATAPAIALADPGATVAADMLGWLSHGVVVPSVHDFQTLRVLILTLMPCFSGPLLGLSLRLCGTGRPFVKGA